MPGRDISCVFVRGDVKQNMAEGENDTVDSGQRRRATLRSRTWIKDETTAVYKRVSSILRKDESQRTDEDKQLLQHCPDVAEEIARRTRKRLGVKNRMKEVEDPTEVLRDKCEQLASAIRHSKCMIVYTGAGISTAAKIPDYRGPLGIWTLLQQGKDIGTYNLTEAQPTLTHMALHKLYEEGIVKHVVSQNCDGLHLRSGLASSALSEVHGNMYIEVCKQCSPAREYLRLFDVTERTARNSHKTGRRCYACSGDLIDTIVHFGERGTLQWPLNWRGAVKAAEDSDIILCLGSSLKVMRRYPWLWGMDKPVKKRPKLYIINLQWTPKDSVAALKINGQCDAVMLKVMQLLNLSIPMYKPECDPVYQLATPLNTLEYHTLSRPLLESYKFCKIPSSKRLEPRSGEFKKGEVVKTEPSERNMALESNDGRQLLYMGNTEYDEELSRSFSYCKIEDLEADCSSVLKGSERPLEVIVRDHCYSKSVEISSLSQGSGEVQSLLGHSSKPELRPSIETNNIVNVNQKQNALSFSYTHYEPVFSFSQGISICQCCDENRKCKPKKRSMADDDCSSDELSETSENCAKGEEGLADKMITEEVLEIPLESGLEQEVETSRKQAVQNPGWFGKGWKVKKKKKRW